MKIIRNPEDSRSDKTLMKASIYIKEEEKAMKALENIRDKNNTIMLNIAMFAENENVSQEALKYIVYAGDYEKVTTNTSRVSLAIKALKQIKDRTRILLRHLKFRKE